MSDDHANGGVEKNMMAKHAVAVAAAAAAANAANAASADGGG